jgi:hypothetical protein
MELSLYDDVSSKNSSSDCQKMKIPKLNKNTKALTILEIYKYC